MARLGETAPPLNSLASCPPTITFTADHPIQVATLRRAIALAPFQPKENLEIVICRSPSFGPSVAKKATGSAANKLKTKMTQKPSTNPRWNTGTAKLPRATVERFKLAESQRVKLLMSRRSVL